MYSSSSIIAGDSNINSGSSIDGNERYEKRAELVLVLLLNSYSYSISISVGVSKLSSCPI